MNATDKIDLEGVMRRVQKLLAIAQDERANPAEAAAAASQAEKTMRKYQIDHLDLMRAEFSKQTSFFTSDHPVRMKMGNPNAPRLVPIWAQSVAVAVAKLHDCKASQERTENGKVLRLSGYKLDVEVAGWTFDYLIRTIINNCREYQRTETRSKMQSNSYRQGFVISICRSLEAMREKKEEEQKSQSTGRELVLIKSQAVAAQFGEAKYGVKKHSVGDVGAFVAGKVDGRRVAVDRRAIPNDPNKTLRIA